MRQSLMQEGFAQFLPPVFTANKTLQQQKHPCNIFATVLI